MKDMLKRMIRGVLNPLGLDVHYYVPPQDPVPLDMLERYGVDMVLDIGAHRGQTARAFRDVGFKGKIVSFEPVEALFADVQEAAAQDPLWTCENVALGRHAGDSEIHVGGGHGATSSMRRMTGLHAANAPELVAGETQAIVVRTLDDVLEQHYASGDRCFLKIDVQGAERDVLEGGMKHIEQVVGLKLEMSLVRSYEDEELLPSMVTQLYDLGFRLTRLDNGWTNANSHELFQADGLFFRPNRCIDMQPWRESRGSEKP